MVVRNADGSGNFFHRKEGVTQGGPLAMISYGIGILPLLGELCDAHNQVKHTWYADSMCVGGHFASLRAHLDDLMLHSPPQGYFPEPTNIILLFLP